MTNINNTYDDENVVYGRLKYDFVDEN